MNDLGIRRSYQGFTLIEFMITLAITAILLGMVAPSMGALIERNRLQTTSERLFTSVLFTRSEALKRNREVVMCKSDDGTSCATGADVQWEQGWLVYSDTDNDGSPDADEILRVSSALSNGITLRMSGDFDDEISYGTDGTANGSGTFVMCNVAGDTQSAREISVSFTGRPKKNKTTTDCETT